MVVARAGGWADGELFNGYRASDWEGEQIVELDDSDGPHKDVDWASLQLKVVNAVKLMCVYGYEKRMNKWPGCAGS